MASARSDISKRMGALAGASSADLDRRNRELQDEKDKFGGPEYWDSFTKSLNDAAGRMDAGAAKKAESTRQEWITGRVDAGAVPDFVGPPAPSPSSGAPAPSKPTSTVEARIHRLAGMAPATSTAPAAPAAPVGFKPVTPATPGGPPPIDGGLRPDTSERMKQSQAYNRAGFEGLGELQRMQVAKDEQLPIGEGQRAKPLADFDTRVRRMAISAERRGQRALSQELSLMAGKYETEEALMDDLNKSDNSEFTKRFGGIRDYTSFLTDQWRGKSEEEIAELQARDERRKKEAAPVVINDTL